MTLVRPASDLAARYDEIRLLGHTTLTVLVTRYYRYVPNLTRRDGTLLARRLGGVR